MPTHLRAETAPLILNPTLPLVGIDFVGDHPKVIDTTKAAVALIGNANANAKIPVPETTKGHFSDQ